MKINSDTEIIVAGLIAFLAYLGWLHFLFKRFRPRLANWLSQKLNVTIEESIVENVGWTITKGGTWWKGLLLFLVEGVVFIGGAFAPLAIAGLWLFLK